MILAEPPPSQGDIHFRVGGIPVRIHPFFWLVALLLGLQGSETPPVQVVTWVVALLGSILVHEMGHAFLQRHYGGHPRVTLYGMGGLAACDDCERSPRAQILIALAGPCAGFLFALVLLTVISAVGHQAGVSVRGENQLKQLGFVAIDMLGANFYWKPFQSHQINLMVWHLLWINGMWGVVNLLPIYPLDGGQVARELCLLGQPRRGMILSLRISVVAAAAMALVGLAWGSFLVLLFFGYLSYSSYRALEAYRASLW